MNRRDSLGAGWALAAGLGLASLLGACGFKLRGEQIFAFDTISVQAVQNGPVAADLRLALGSKLAASGALASNAVAAAPATATPGSPASHVTMDILQEQREKTVVGINAAGQVREFQLRIRVRFRLRNAAGKDLIEDSEILQQRDITFNESAVLAKEAEEALLYRDMQADIVQQLLRRLAAIKTL